MSTKLFLALSVFSMMQMGSLIGSSAQAKDLGPMLVPAESGVKRVGTADDSGSSVRDPQSNAQAHLQDPAVTGGHSEKTDLTLGHPATESNGRSIWNR